MAMARLRSLGKWMPISARALFIVHCTTGSASAISDSMRSSNAGGSSPFGLVAGRPAVVVGHPLLAKRLLLGVLLDDIGHKPVRHVREAGGSHQPVHLFG